MIVTLLVARSLQELIYQLSESNKDGLYILEPSKKYSVIGKDYACLEVRRAHDSLFNTHINVPLAKALQESIKTVMADRSLKSLLIGRRGCSG